MSEKSENCPSHLHTAEVHVFQIAFSFFANNSPRTLLLIITIEEGLTSPQVGNWIQQMFGIVI